MRRGEALRRFASVGWGRLAVLRTSTQITSISNSVLAPQPLNVKIAQLNQNSMTIHFSETRDIELTQIIFLYKANRWSSIQKPQELHQGLLNSHYLVSAWDGSELVGIGNAISDGYLVVYYPHLIVHPDYQHQGIGKQLMEMLQRRYQGFHMQILVADQDAIAFYEKCGFVKAENTQAMWYLPS
ncbi:acetyltransferase, GNAT family protein [Calothrix sp. NIES-3974]|nr:acetyltransferase, GNAT family protein [Calothrix sp. NIES-3974]